MDQAHFQSWLSIVDVLSDEQRSRTIDTLTKSTQASASIAAVELGVGEDRKCPRCGTSGAVKRGKANGLMRYRCKGCARTFNAVTGTPLQGLHHKDRWLAFAQSLSGAETVKASARRCDVDPTTAFRWRHRFLAAAKTVPDKLKGIVEADETFVLESRKGSRSLSDRKPRKRGGKATKRGISDEQTPVLIAVARGGPTFGKVLDHVTAQCLEQAIKPVLDGDSLLVTDASPSWKACAASMGISHEILNRRAGETVRGALHIQTANSRHSWLKDFLRRFRGVATCYLENYLTWFGMAGLQDTPPRGCLARATNRQCLAFAN